MILTDLNLDCLETDFEYLGFSDLLNLADTNKRIRRATELVFIRKYQHKKLIINDCLHDGQIYITDNSIEIHNIKPCLQILRCFGPFITAIDFRAQGHKR